MNIKDLWLKAKQKHFDPNDTVEVPINTLHHLITCHIGFQDSSAYQYFPDIVSNETLLKWLEEDDG
jgi:hypothetical protein